MAPLGKPGLAPKTLFEMELEGVSADGTHAVFRSNGKLAPGGKAGSYQLYESVRGAPPRFVCLKPGGAPVAGGCTAGAGPREETRGTNVSGAISKDGGRIYWTDEVEDKLYVRIGGSQTLDVSKAAEAQAGTKGSSFWGAAADGSRAIFTTGGRLYRFTLAGEATQLLAEGVIGVMGMSEDANRVYFASSKALAPGATEGKPNLYLYEASGGGGGATSFVATLAAGDVNATHGPIVLEPHQRSARVSPDGAHAAFTSLAPLTGYDNADASTGEAAKEVYLYDAAAKKLLCASCNPSGARPRSVATEGTRFSARIPGFETQMHAAHVLSDNGSRLYFESADTLSPADSNGAVDVYQWEAPGAGSCKAASPSYSPQDEGCLELISSGQSPIDSRFVEATANGKDVFFATLSSLLPQDYGLIDIYDARAGGGLPMPSAAASCEGEACQSPPAPPNDPTPGSSSFEGAGNVHEASAKDEVQEPEGEASRQVRQAQGPQEAQAPFEAGEGLMGFRHVDASHNTTAEHSEWRLPWMRVPHLTPTPEQRNLSSAPKPAHRGRQQGGATERDSQWSLTRGSEAAASVEAAGRFPVMIGPAARSGADGRNL